MGERDWAVVIGISHYPGMESLDGPENDANLFYKWLVSKKGGNVPRRHIKKIVSSDFKPLTRRTIYAQPNREELNLSFEKLLEAAAEAPDRQLGRRLYIYMAGHGFADLRDTTEQTALLSAKATRESIGGQHVLGEYTATSFRRAGYFEEVILFMDCCSEAFLAPPFNYPWDLKTDDDAYDVSRYYHGFAAGWKKMARERKMDDGLVHGVFTWALIKGLEGSGADPDTGEITASALTRYLYNQMKEFLSKGDKNDSEVAKEPKIFFPREQGEVISFGVVKRKATTAADAHIENGAQAKPEGEVKFPTFPVIIEVPASAFGQPIVVKDGALQIIAQKKPRSAQWKLRLKAGLYSALLGDKKILFEVGGTHDVPVKF